MTVFLTPDGRPVLRRHLLPARPRRGMPAFLDAAAGRSTTPGATGATTLAEQAGQLTERARPAGAARAGRRRRPGAERARRRRRRAARPPARRRVGRLRPGAQVPPDDEPRAAAAGRTPAPATPADAATVVDHVARRHGVGRHLRPPRRRLRPLLGRRAAGWCPTSRRCSTTRRCWPGSTSTPGRSPARPATARCSTRRSATCCATCATRRRLLLGRGRRLRGRGGHVLRLDARTRSAAARAAPTADAADRVVRRHRGGQLRGRATSSTGRVRGDLPRPPRDRAGPAGAVRRPRAAGAARPRRQGAHRVERPDAADAGRGGGRHRRRADWLDGGRGQRPSSCSPSCAAPTGAGCGRGRPTAAPATWPTPPTTPPWSTPSPAWPRPPARPAGSTRPGHGRRPARPVLGRRAAAALFTTGHDAERAGRPAEGPGRQRHARRPTAWPPSACCAWPPSPATTATASAAEDILRLLGAPGRAATRPPSPTCWPPSTCSPAAATEVAVVGDRPDLVAAVQRALPAPRRAGLGRALRLAAVGGPGGRPGLRVPGLRLPGSRPTAEALAAQLTDA